MTEEEHIRAAELNKRNWGYNSFYKPELARSRKKLLMDTLGGFYYFFYFYMLENYRYAEKFEEMYTWDKRSLGEILEEENNWE
jgi:hypothetical protein